MQQLSLDERNPGQRPPRARRNDPDSSHLAADRMEKSGAMGEQMQAVLDAVKRYDGSTSKELAELSGLDRHAVARRLPELETKKLIHATEHPGGCRWWIGEGPERLRRRKGK